jgi:hypothetical protein
VNGEISPLELVGPQAGYWVFKRKRNSIKKNWLWLFNVDQNNVKRGFTCEFHVYIIKSWKKDLKEIWIKINIVPKKKTLSTKIDLIIIT